MKLSLRLRRILLLPMALLLAGSLSADIIELKTGEKIDCKILSETDTTITYQYQLTPKIPDTKTIAKDTVKAVVKFTPAQVEFEKNQLKQFETTKDLLSASDYESIIQDRLRTFVAKFPGTPEAEKVQKMIDTLVEEKAKVLAGGVKLNGVWLDEATAKRERYNIDARRIRNAMRDRLTEEGEVATQPKEAKALREFETLRTSYPASMEYHAAIPEALEILDRYDRRLAAMAAEQPILKKQRDDALKGLSGPELQRGQQAIQEEERSFRASLDVQKKNKVKWQDIYKYDLKSITDARTAVTKERADLNGINLVAFQNEIESLNAAIAYIAEGKAVEAEEKMAPLRPNKSTLVNKKVFDEYDKKLTELKAKISAELKKTKAAAGATAPTPGTETTPDSSNPIADAMKKDDKGKDDPAKKEKDKATQSKTTSTPSTTSKPAVEPEEELTMLQKINKYIPFIGGGLLVILIIAMVMGKKKKDEDE